MTSHTDADHNTTTWVLDARGNVLEELEPGTFYGVAGYCETDYTYTSAPSGIGGLPGGLVSVETDAAGTEDETVTTTTYYSDPSSDTGLVGSVAVDPTYDTEDSYTLSYQYDSNGNPSQSTDEYGRVTEYVYDALNRLVTQTDPAPGTSTNGVADPAPATQYRYDALGNQVSTTDPDGNTTTSSYDALNRLASTTAPRRTRRRQARSARMD